MIYNRCQFMRTSFLLLYYMSALRMLAGRCFDSVVACHQHVASELSVSIADVTCPLPCRRLSSLPAVKCSSSSVTLLIVWACRWIGVGLTRQRWMRWAVHHTLYAPRVNCRRNLLFIEKSDTGTALAAITGPGAFDSRPAVRATFQVERAMN